MAGIPNRVISRAHEAGLQLENKLQVCIHFPADAVTHTTSSQESTYVDHLAVHLILPTCDHLCHLSVHPNKITRPI